ncbi:MAG: hypothetical protein JW712_04440 [Dehalococcoidales bacterium]|nr:hypothetical protein [Dehalococcoidales bacterium]
MAPAVVDYVEHPFGRGILSSNGVQFGQEKTTSTNDYESVEEVTISPPRLGKVLEFEFGLTCAVKSSGTGESVKFKWQARNKGGTWVDLTDEITYAADASDYKEYTYSGRFNPEENFNSIPFDMRLVIKSGSAGGENAIGKTKNSSYVRAKYASY